MQPDNRLLTNLIKCEKEHHTALLSLLVRSHTSLAALSAYASAAAPPVAHALLGCIQSFATADEGLRGYAAAVEGWKEELKEVRRVEDELKAVVRDKDILVGRLIKASKQKIPTSSLQAGPAPIPNASYLAQSSPSSSSFSLPSTGQQYGQTGYQYTPTPHATQHINAKLALAQRELHACEAHLAGKESELAEVRRSAMTEGMARRCRAMAEVGSLWRERGEQALHSLDELGREGAGAPPLPQSTYTPPRRSHSSHSRSQSGSSLAPSHSASQHHSRTRSASPFGLPRATSPFGGAPGTYQTLAGGYQHSHPLPALPERDSWHVERGREEYDPREGPREREGRERPVTYHAGSYETPRPSSSFHPDPSHRPVSFHPGPTSSIADSTYDRRPISSLGLGPAPHVEFDIPPAHSIGDHGDIIPLGRPVSSVGFNAEQGGWVRDREWGDESSEEMEGYRVVENDRWRGGARSEEGGEGGEEVDPEILRAVEKMGMVVPPKDKPVRTHPPTPPETSSSVASPVPALRVTEATPQKKGKRGDGERVKRKSTRRKQGEDQADIPASVSAPARLAPASGLAPTPTSTAALPAPAARPVAERVIVAPSPTVRASPDLPALPELQPPAPARDSSSSTVHSPATQPPPASPLIQPAPASPLVQPTQTVPTTQTPPTTQPQVSTPPPSTSSFNPEAEFTLHTSLEPASPRPESRASLEPYPIGSAALDHDDVIITGEEDKIGQGQRGMSGLTSVGQEDEAGAVLPTTEAVSVLPLETTATEPTPTLTAAMPLVKPRPGVERTPTVSKPRETKSRITSSASEPLVLSPTRANSKAGPKRRVASGLESAGETSGTDRGGRKKASAKRKTAPTPKRQPSAEERAGLAAMLRDADAPSPHVHFPAAGGMYVPSAPPVTKQPGALFLPTSGGGTTRSDIGPARSPHFDTGASALPPPSPVTVTRGRSGSGSVSFFGRVAGLFGRKKNSVDDYVPSGGGAAWRTRTDGNLARGGGGDSSDDEPRAGLVAVSNVNTPAGRMTAVDNKPTPDSPKRGVGRKLTKADKGQTLRVGPPPIDTDMSARNRKSSLTGADRDERFEVASPVGGAGKGKKARGEKVRSVDGGGLSRKGSLKSNTSEPVSTGSGRTSSDKKRGAASLMALVEGPGLVLPSELAQRSQSPVPPKRRTDSPARGQSPARSQTPQSLLSVPPARMVSPTTTAAPKPVRATSPMPLKSAMRRTPSPMPNPPTPVDIPILSSPPSQDTSPVATSPTTGLSVPPIKIDASSPRNSIVAESLYETGEEDFDDATDGEAESDGTVAHANAPKQDSPAPAHAIIPPPAHASAASPSAGTALAAFKSTISAPNSDTAMSVSTAGPYSAGGTQPARRKSVRINPDPPEMSATPAATPAIELDEEPKWSQGQNGGESGSGGWATRIGRGWEDSSEESGEDEEYERVRRALATSYKHLDAVNVPNSRGREKEMGKSRR